MAECRLDSLEELKLGPGTFKEDVDPSTFPSFATFTRLQILTTFVYSNALQNFIPWAQLTDLTLVGCGLPDIALDVLAQCSNLEKALVNITVWSLSPAKRDILVLGQLDNLILAFSGAGHVTPFFDCLSLPALDMLYVHFEDTASGEGSWSEAHFRITALQLRFPNITRLHLSKAWCLTSEDLKAILRHTQCLTKLYLTDVNGCFDDTVVDALSFKHGIEPLVPRLHDFLFQETQSNNFSEDILANAIASRWWTDVEMASRRVPPVVARWVNVELRGNFSEHFADRMQILQCKGLPVACIRTSVGSETETDTDTHTELEEDDDEEEEEESDSD
ncbi:hypothetical protein K438DRAFT_318443 [Mycena galopus ATCC 62051]|nr:hypothetical protein K438DRAFT_318443 [Mycena galopus ATCC 62051]